METIEKIDVKKMKEDIKKMVEDQKMYKMYRKFYLRIDGRLVVPKDSERKINQREAQWKHQFNRIQLRKMYAAYALAKGKSISLIDRHPEEVEELALKILEKYKIKVQVETV